MKLKAGSLKEAVATAAAQAHASKAGGEGPKSLTMDDVNRLIKE